MDRREEVIRIFSRELRSVLNQLPVDFNLVQEIRLRAEKPLLLTVGGREVAVGPQGRICQDPRGAYQVSRQDLKETMEYVSSYSLYAFEEEIRQGFLTIQGGHRVGLAGKAVAEEGRIRGMKFISFLNVRLAHQVKGCAAAVLPGLCQSGRILNTLILSPPRWGKTTLLRDLIRLVSDGTEELAGRSVGVVDERSEIGACFQGIPQNDVGMRTDVLDCCPKAQGMMMLIRSMAPEVLAVDEIGGTEDLEAVRYAVNCGCSLIATAHGASLEELLKKPCWSQAAREGWFERYVILDGREGAGHVAKICDRTGQAVIL